MKKYKSYIFFLSSAFWLFVALPVTHAQSTLESQLDSLVAERLETRMVRDSLQHKIDSLAVVIYEVKSASPGYFEKKKLQNYLRESLELSDRLQDAQIRAKHLDERIAELGNRLFVVYDRRIDSLVQHSLQTSEWALKISALQKKRKRLEKWLEPEQNFESMVDIDISETDTPEEIELKVSFYRDQAQRLVQQAKQMNEHIARVRQENRIRQRMSDLVDDVTLFAQNDEPVIVENPPAKLSTDYAGPTGNPEGAFRESSDNAALTQNLITEPSVTLDLKNMAPQELDRYIKVLETQEKRYSQLADSLRQMAEKYEKEAEKLRNSLKPY